MVVQERYCACGCGEPLPAGSPRKRHYLDGPHRQRALRLRKSGANPEPRPRLSVIPPAAEPRPEAAAELAARLQHIAEVFPPPHAAMVRLIVYAVLGRARLGPHQGAPAFSAYGEGGRGKTIIAEAVRWVFGWPEHWPLIADLHGVPAGELVGRHVNTGRGRQEFELAEYPSLPLLCCDELDKPRSPQVLGEVFGLIKAGGLARHEGRWMETRAVVLTTHNPNLRKGPDPLRTDAWRRRTIGLDVDRTERVDPLRFAPLLASHGPELPLDLPGPTPDPEMVQDVLTILRDELADGAWAMVEHRMIPDLLTGHMALPGDLPELVEDLLLLAETRGELRVQVRHQVRQESEAIAPVIPRELLDRRQLATWRVGRLRKEIPDTDEWDWLRLEADGHLDRLESAQTEEELLAVLSPAETWVAPAKDRLGIASEEYADFREVPHSADVANLPAQAEVDEEEWDWGEWLAEEYGLDHEDLEHVADLRERYPREHIEALCVRGELWHSGPGGRASWMGTGRPAGPIVPREVPSPGPTRAIGGSADLGARAEMPVLPEPGWAGLIRALRPRRPQARALDTNRIHPRWYQVVGPYVQVLPQEHGQYVNVHGHLFPAWEPPPW